MGPPQSQKKQGLFAGFTCTSVKPEPDGVVIEVDYDECKKVAFAEDLDLKGSEAIVNYPLYKLYDILKEKNKIKLTSEDYVFITWLQPIPPTFHTINQVAYIVSIAIKLRKRKIPHVLIPYIYFYHEKGLENVDKCFDNLPLEKKNPEPRPRDLLDHLKRLTQKLPIYPSLILLETTPSVIGWFDHAISVNLHAKSNAINDVNYQVFNLDLVKKWLKHAFTPQDFVKIVEERMKLPSDIKEGIQKEITNIYDTIPDALPLAVAYSILFPLQFLRNLRNVVILLFGMTPRDIIYYLAVEKALNSEGKKGEFPKVFYIPTRSLIHDYATFINKISSLNNKVGIINCFKNPFISQHGSDGNKTITDKISVALLLLFHKTTQEFICVNSSQTNECKIINKASETYKKIIDKILTKAAQEKHQCGSMNLFHLLYDGECVQGSGRTVLATYSSESRETVNAYIVYYRGKKHGQIVSAPVICASADLEPSDLEPSVRHMGIKSIDLSKIKLPIPTWYYARYFIDINRPHYVKFAFLQGEIELKPERFWLTNILYYFVLE
jgi:hypothetical protein